MMRVTASLTGLLVTALLAGCSATAPASGPADIGAVVGLLREGGVEVTFGWISARGAQPVLTARFKPQQSEFHLYSVDLAADGVDGVGRPTRLEVGGALSAIGVPLPDVRTVSLRVQGLDAPLPVYPDGPVTLRQTVRVAPGLPAVVWVTYAACSASTCLPPVSHHRVALALPEPP